MKVWITKYALTRGIQEMDVVRDNPEADMVKAPGLFNYFHGEGREWHLTAESARTKAEKMRKDRLASLNKSIKKLEKLIF